MKNLTNYLTGVCFLLAAAACEHQGRHVVIKSGDSYNETKIEYYGRTVFNQDGSSILHITPNGSVTYKHNEQKLVAESDNMGHITYQINGSDREQQLSSQDKIFLARAIKEMKKHGHNDD